MAPRLAPLLVLLVSCASVPVPRSAALRETCTERVCLIARQEPTGYVLAAMNRLPAPVSVELEFPELENLEPSRALPVRAVVPAESELPVLSLKIRERTRGARYRSLFRAELGDPAALHDDEVLYALPFGGSQRRVLSQGVDGRVSHRGARRYAFDFDLPEGTPVVAARAGVVVQVQDGFGPGALEEWRKTESNAITVAHADGTFATYGHLQKGILRRPGEPVEPGDLLAYSGNSGYSSAPHLHFHVWKHGRRELAVTVPVRFTIDGARGFVPVVGRSYPPTPPARLLVGKQKARD